MSAILQPPPRERESPAGPPHTATPHESARGHVTGEALYTDDLIAHYPGLLHAWPVMAPYAHATLARLDAKPATEQPGVVAVLSGDDVPGEGDSSANRHDEPLFPRETLYHSQPVAWILGETLEAARLGAARVETVFEKLPAILTIDAAIAANRFHSGPFHMQRGDAASAIAESPHRLTGELRIGGQEHFYLETQCAIARPDTSGGMIVDSSTQHPSETQEVVARVLGIPRNRVTVECLRMGGAFGGKETQANPWAAIASLGAWKTKRPVRVRLPRHLDMLLTGKRHPFLSRFRAGFDDDGRLRGVELTLWSDAGFSGDLSDPVMWRALFHCDNAYLIPALEATGWVCKTHKTSQTAFRGFGGPQGMLVIEDILDRIARALAIDPHVVRERNFYREGDATHYGQPVKDASRIARIWDELKQTSAFDARRKAVARFNATHEHVKRGIAVTPVKFGISFTATFYNQAGATVLVYRDGSVQINHGGTEMGQGLHTKILRIAADSLGVPEASIRIMATSTAKIPNTSATAASAGTDLNGAAVADACRQIRERLAAIPDAANMTFAKTVEAAYKSRISLFAQGYYRTPEIHFDAKTATGKPFHYFAYGAAVSEVEVDGFTGQYRTLRTDILHDVGDSVSPSIDRGQIEGAFIQGVGWLTLEELLWDQEGRVATAGASTYKLPSWPEMPAVFEVALLDRAAEPGVVMGSKAVGEPPLMLAFSVREAIRAAIAEFGESSGVIPLNSPATPECVFRAICAARGESL
jgi:xanthine dehydrogenase large subunit